MKTYRIAIIGGTGLLGSNLSKLYFVHDIKTFSRMNAMNIDNTKNKIINFNFLQRDLYNYFKEWKPDIIINAVGLVNLQLCEDNYALAKEINLLIPKQLALVSKKINAYFIHISTDHYYNDLKKKHNENDDVVLLNNYAKIKYEAEKEVLKNHKTTLIVRTNIIGFRRNNVDSFFEWLLGSISRHEKINLYSNFFTSSISVNLLGDILLKCFEKELVGIYNISSSEVIDKYCFGIKTANLFGFSVDNISKSKINNHDTENLVRALSLGLDVSRIENALSIKMPTIDKTIESLHKEYYGGCNE